MTMVKFQQQAELIERVKAALNLTDVQLAAEVDVRPETMQKYAAGYQKAGGRLMQLLDRLMDSRQRPGDAAPPARPAPSFVGGGQRYAPAEINGERCRDLDLTAPSTQEQLDKILTQGTMEEIRLVRQLIETLSRQIHSRQYAPAHGKPVVLDGKHRLLPALGYIPAGLPQEVIQQASQFIPVPEGKFPEADFALKVQGDSMVDAGIHHGDWVVMTTRREPRNGSVVAALCDGETCLKTYISDERRGSYLRSENKAYPPKIIPKDEMQIQGVMLGKLASVYPAGAVK
jgi:SOS-response transcriptional repressor LexA